MREVVEKLKKIPGVRESVELDNKIKMSRNKTFDTELDSYINNLHKRLEWLNKKMEEL